MKSIAILIVAAGISLNSCGQDIPESKVPSVVLNAVQLKHPGVSNVDWEKKKDHFEAEFKIDSVEHTLSIDAAGKILQHKKDISNQLIPADVLAAVKAAYAGYTIDEAELIEKNGQVIYEIELEAKGKKDVTVFYSADGKVVSKS